MQNEHIQPEDVEVSDADLLAFGYAPGNYTSKCMDCNGEMWGVDKRCRVCRPCAAQRRLKAMTNKPDFLPSKERVPQDLCEACAHPDRHHFEDGDGNIICRSTADCACIHRVEHTEQAGDETPVFQIQGFEDDY